MVECAISSIDLLSSNVMETGFSLCRMASTFLLMFNMSCILSFHWAKFLLSNFLISTPVPDVEATFFFESEIFDDLVFLISAFSVVR